MFWETVATIVMVILLILLVIVLGLGILLAYALIVDIRRMRRKK